MFWRAPSVETAATVAIFATEGEDGRALQAEDRAEIQASEFAELTACIEAGVIRSRRRVRIFQSVHFTLALTCAVLMIGSIFVMFAGVESSVGWGLLIGAGSFFTGSLGLILGMIGAGRDRRLTRERAAALKLAALDDPRAAGSLIDAIHWIMQWAGHRAMRPELWKTLERLLPRLTEEEARELGRERHGLLVTWISGWDTLLYRKHYTDLGNKPLLAMLHVMELVGENAIQVGQQPFRMTLPLLPVLEKWIAGRGAGQDPAVQEAAVACRDAILRKSALACSGDQLLRASAPAPSSPETLLRPAKSAMQTDPQQLLRPHDPD